MSEKPSESKIISICPAQQGVTVVKNTGGSAIKVALWALDERAHVHPVVMDGNGPQVLREDQWHNMFWPN